MGSEHRSGDLWALIDAKKDKTRILSAMRRAHQLDDEESDRRSDVFHPSEMAKADWCWRHDYYRISGAPAESSQHSFELQNIFDEGHTIHDKWQQRLWSAGMLGGIFECMHCDERWEACSPTECPWCAAGRRFLRYKEVPLHNEAMRIQGHADGRIEDDHDPALMEIKSVGEGTIRMEAPHLLDMHTKDTTDGKSVLDLSGLWRDIKRPFPTHVRQAMIYLWLSGLKTMIFIYEFKSNQQMKEFSVRYNHSIMEPILERVEETVYALDQGKPPERPGWADPDKTCKACPYFKGCWENEHENEQEARQEDGAREARPRRRRRARGVGAGDAQAPSEEDVVGDRAPAEVGRRPRRPARQRADVADGEPHPLGQLLEGQARRRRG